MSAAVSAAEKIDGVVLRELQVFGDHRGRVFEGWRESWTPFTVKQLTEGRAQAGVMKGLHLHYVQWDYWRIVTGRMFVGLYDARPTSPTHTLSTSFEMTPDAPTALSIPPGVAHGYYAVEDLEMIYLLSEVYNPDDEFGVRADSVGIDWPHLVAGTEPLISERDISLPTAQEFVFSPPSDAA
jgi:dTDP-4-dehydrorhamnose 3,5-epimerase